MSRWSCKKARALLWPCIAGSRKGQTLRQHGSVMSKMRAGNALKVFLCIPLGVIWGHMVDIEESPLKSPINVRPSPHKVRIGQFTGLYSCLVKCYSLEVCCGLIHACNKKWNSFVSTNYFFPVLVRNITFHGSQMEYTSCQNSKTSATSCLSKTKFIVKLYTCICVNYAR